MIAAPEHSPSCVDEFTLDILLHQSGHIMLSDFDLAKQSNEPGGRPAMIHQSEPDGVSHSASLSFHSQFKGN